MVIMEEENERIYQICARLVPLETFRQLLSHKGEDQKPQAKMNNAAFLFVARTLVRVSMFTAHKANSSICIKRSIPLYSFEIYC